MRRKKKNKKQKTKRPDKYIFTWPIFFFARLVQLFIKCFEYVPSEQNPTFFFIENGVHQSVHQVCTIKQSCHVYSFKSQTEHEGIVIETSLECFLLRLFLRTPFNSENMAVSQVALAWFCKLKGGCVIQNWLYSTPLILVGVYWLFKQNTSKNILFSLSPL